MPGRGLGARAGAQDPARPNDVDVSVWPGTAEQGVRACPVHEAVVAVCASDPFDHAVVDHDKDLAIGVACQTMRQPTDERWSTSQVAKSTAPRPTAAARIGPADPYGVIPIAGHGVQEKQVADAGPVRGTRRLGDESPVGHGRAPAHQEAWTAVFFTIDTMSFTMSPEEGLDAAPTRSGIPD